MARIRVNVKQNEATIETISVGVRTYIKGEPGTTGSNGTNGINGSNGLSAYQIAVNNGFQGNEAAWLASLVGNSEALNTLSIFPNQYGQNIRIATAIIRPVWDQSTNTVTWVFINDQDHGVIFFNTLTTPNNAVVRLGFPTVKKVLAFQISNDEASTRYGIVAGAGVGLNHADINFSFKNPSRQVITFNGSVWENTGQVFTSSVFNSGNIIVVNTSSNGLPNLETSYGNLQAMYAGTNNRLLRHVFNGLNYNQNKFELIDPSNGVVQSPSIGDSIILWNPDTNKVLSTQNTNTSELSQHIYSEELLNFWVIGIFEV